MASTYTLISSNVLSGTAASVTFSAIPATYTDLVLRVSARNSTSTAYSDNTNIMQVYVNGGVYTYSNTRLSGNGSAAASSRTNPSSAWESYGGTDAGTATANTFSSFELYIPNYLLGSYKVASMFSTSENNATTNSMSTTAALINLNTALDTIQLFNNYGSFVSGSSFYLYGIKSS
jgi:hypothetical protein